MVKENPSKENHFITHHQTRELLRLKQFLTIGTEASQYTGERHKSIGSWLTRDTFEPYRRWPMNGINCINYLWNFCKRKDKNVQDHVTQLIVEVIDNQNGQFWPCSLAMVIYTLYDCKSIKNCKSTFRELSYSLIDRLDSMSLLTFVRFYGHKSVNQKLKNAISQWYTKRVVTHPLELIIYGNKWGWRHLDVIRWYHIKVDDPLLKQIANIRDNSENPQQLDAERSEILSAVKALRSSTNKSDDSKLSDEIKSIVKVFESDVMKDHSNLWIRALNTKYINDVNIWLNMFIDGLPIENVIINIPRLLHRYPNNFALSDSIASRIESSARDDVPPFIVHMVKHWINKNAETEKQKLKWPCLCRALSKLRQSLPISKDVYVIINLSEVTDADPIADQLKHDRFAKRWKIPLFESLMTHNDMASFVIQLLGDKAIGHCDSETPEKINGKEIKNIKSNWGLIPKECSNVLYLYSSSDVCLDMTDEMIDMINDKKLMIASIRPAYFGFSSTDGSKKIPYFSENLMCVNVIDRHFGTVMHYFFK